MLRNNLYTVEVEGGLLPGSNVPTTGNVNNLINVNNGGFGGSGIGRWTNFGIPYRITELTAACRAGSSQSIRASRWKQTPARSWSFARRAGSSADGLPNAPITFKGSTPGQTWSLRRSPSTPPCFLDDPADLPHVLFRQILTRMSGLTPAA